MFKKSARIGMIVIVAAFSLAGSPSQTQAVTKQSALTDGVKTAPTGGAVAGASSIPLPSGYSVTTVQAGCTVPTKAIWAPAASLASAGETFVAEHAGIVWRTNLATGVRTKMLDISAHVNSYG